MTAEEKIQHAYVARVRTLGDVAGEYLVSYVPRGLQAPKTSGKQSRKVPEHRATINVLMNAPVQWNSPPFDPEATLVDFEKDARRRAKLVHDWLALLAHLIASVEHWAKELTWPTKRIEKPMEDSEVGHYQAPALLLQEDADRFLLEPVARAGPGQEGLVDLYLMPAYDDIASLYYYNKRWNLHYMPHAQSPVSNGREVVAKPLTKLNLRKVIDEMKEHAE